MRSHNHFRSGKTIIVTYSEYVSAALVIHLAKHMATYRGADKSLARPGWKQATATKL